MEFVGILELVTKQTKKGNDFWTVNVNGKSAGSAFDAGIVSGFVNGEMVKVTSEAKGAYKNVKSIERVTSPTTTIPGEVTAPVSSVAHYTVPSPKGYEPHAKQIRMSALHNATLVVGELYRDTAKKPTQTTLRTREALVLNTAKGFEAYLQTGEVDVIEKDIVEAAQGD